MLDFDERLQFFRFHHVKLAQRIIGAGMIGTLRNEITADTNAPGGNNS
jgi:tryptophan 2,3-dioxygenase